MAEVCGPISIDVPAAEGRYRLEPAHELTPERLFERRWALDLLGHVLSRLEAEAAESGKVELFTRLRPMLEGDPGAESYSDVGMAVGLSEGAVKVAAHRLRARYREVLREEVEPYRRRPGRSGRRAVRPDQLARRVIRAATTQVSSVDLTGGCPERSAEATNHPFRAETLSGHPPGFPLFRAVTSGLERWPGPSRAEIRLVSLVAASRNPHACSFYLSYDGTAPEGYKLADGIRRFPFLELGRVPRRINRLPPTAQDLGCVASGDPTHSSGF